MYDMTTNRLPAPYELNQKVPSSYSVSAPNSYLHSNEMSFAKGGRTGKHKGMIKVHINPQEIRALDHIQGFSEHAPDGVKMYPGLEDILKNRHLVENVHKHSHKHRMHHYAGGYSPSVQHLREGGRYGDTEIAMIGPRTKHLFDNFSVYPTKNPYTGHPEYWSIGSALNGLWDTVSGAASKIPSMFSGAADAAAPALQNAVSGIGNAIKSDQFKNFATGALNATQPLIQETLNKNLGENWGNIAGQIGKQAQNTYLGEGDPNSMWNQAGRAAGTSINKYNQGYTPQQASGYGINQFGQNIGGGVGQGLAGFGGSLAQGGNFRNAGMQGGRDFYNALGGNQGLRNAAQGVANRFAQGIGTNSAIDNTQQALREQMNQYRQMAMPQRQEQIDMANRNMSPSYYDPYYEEKYIYG